jgi:hypothetical protein
MTRPCVATKVAADPADATAKTRLRVLCGASGVLRDGLHHVRPRNTQYMCTSAQRPYYSFLVLTGTANHKEERWAREELVMAAYLWLMVQPSFYHHWNAPTEGNSWLCALTDERSQLSD